jgi:hypothetical protein
MLTLPKNCKVIYTNSGVNVRMTYATELPEGVYDGVTVFQTNGYIDKNGRNIKGKKYFALEFNVDYQKNLPMLLTKAYFEHKKKAMLWGRMQKQQLLQREIDALSKSNFPGTWDINHFRNPNAF